jgi:ankyrin repeat protein
LNLATTRQLPDVISFLLSSKGIDHNLADSNGYTPLLAAAELGALPSMTTLLRDTQVRTDCKTLSGRTVISFLAESNQIGIDSFVVDLIQKKRVQADVPDHLGRAPISYACEAGNVCVVWLLLMKADVDVARIDEGGRTPLSYHCGVKRSQWWDTSSLNGRHNEHDVCAEALMERSIGVIDTKDSVGRTPLSYAAEAGSEWHIDALLRYGADLFTEDRTGKTAIFWARYGNEPDLADWLQNKILRRVDPAEAERLK